ncbi:MAG: hypothetical protein FWG84_07450 [Bacteroidales bacterium]|nr:hypothetical protein [Bacteroidales bacterium]
MGSHCRSQDLTIAGAKVGNYEMETSTLYGLCAAMGHNALTVCLVIAHRFFKTANFDYHDQMNELIDKVLKYLILPTTSPQS